MDLISDLDWSRWCIFSWTDLDLACATCRSGRRRYNHEEETPEWFTGGPTSQNETIELRGFEREGERGHKNRREAEEVVEVEANEYQEEEKAPHAAVNEAGDAQKNANGTLICPVSFCKLPYLEVYAVFLF